MATSTLRITGLCCFTLAAQVAFAAEDAVDYLKQVKPLLATKCYSCHGVLKQEAGLRLETRSLMLKGGDSGPAIVAGNVDGSLILQRIRADEDSRMPPAEDGAALKPDEIELLTRWIQQNAAAPQEAVPLAPQEHWAFLPITKPQLNLIPSKQKQNPIDVLLAARLSRQGLKPQPRAERSVLIRRLYLDLVGLPPTLKQLHDKRPWAEIVDELLASPHHGERWGRHWMDVWRYSDWYGLGAQLRNSQKHIWRWRDWIVESLNNDKGYDRMIQEMLAGDELDPDNLEAIAGTGFLARNYYLFNRTTWLDSTIEHTGKAFLGLTLNCAKCHDHKYDPITHVDYYSFRAIFEPHQVRLDPVPGVTDFEKDGLPRVFDDHLDAETWLHLRGNPKNLDKQTKIVPRVPAILASFQPEIQPIDLPTSAFAPAVRDYVQQTYLAKAEADITLATQQLASAKTKLAAAPPTTTSKTLSDGSANNKKRAEFKLTDNFDQATPEVWEIVGKGWKFQDGKLLQTTSTRDAEFVRLKKPLPKDFEVRCRYITTGGSTYKSVTFRFDQSADTKYANFVYTSAFASGPKVQAAFTRNGSHSYPPAAKANRPIKVGEPIDLRFAVRDQLVNVWLNDKFVLAYRFPDRRPDGRFAFSGFDATVAFDSISFRSLDPDVKLVESNNVPAPSPQDPAVALKIAEAKLAAVQARHAAVRAVLTAEKSKYGDTSESRKQSLSNTAVRLQAEAALAEADHELFAAGGDANKTKAAQAKAKAARQKLELAKQGKGQYASIRASRKALETPAHKENMYSPTYSSKSTGRRLALAQWVTSVKNPLTARVAVNHVWMRHFGEPLVESVFDFGLRAKKPLHADVLDYLAAEFMESNWSFKHLHRLITTSQSYQLSSSTKGADGHTLATDATNRFYWRMNTRRMEAQIVRDSLLTLAGKLDRKLGGPSLNVGATSNRRSLYFKHSRDQQDKFLSMFDDADLLQCYRRSESIVPQQALALANSRLSMTMAMQITNKLNEANPNVNEAEFISLVFETILARKPLETEQQVCQEFCQELRKTLGAEKADVSTNGRIHTRLVHSLLNHNDFITIR